MKSSCPVDGAGGSERAGLKDGQPVISCRYTSSRGLRHAGGPGLTVRVGAACRTDEPLWSCKSTCINRPVEPERNTT